MVARTQLTMSKQPSEMPETRHAAPSHDQIREITQSHHYILSGGLSTTIQTFIRKAEPLASLACTFRNFPSSCDR